MEGTPGVGHVWGAWQIKDSRTVLRTKLKDSKMSFPTQGERPSLGTCGDSEISDIHPDMLGLRVTAKQKVSENRDLTMARRRNTGERGSWQSLSVALNP